MRPFRVWCDTTERFPLLRTACWMWEDRRRVRRERVMLEGATWRTLTELRTLVEREHPGSTTSTTVNASDAVINDDEVSVRVQVSLDVIGHDTQMVCRYEFDWREDLYNCPEHISVRRIELRDEWFECFDHSGRPSFLPPAPCLA